MKQVDLWSGCKLYLLWLAVLIPSNYLVTRGRGKSGTYIIKLSLGISIKPNFYGRCDVK